MTQLMVERPTQADAVVADIREAVSRRLDAATYPPCPVEFASSFVGMCASQSCGKCTPCRIGLAQLKKLLDDVLDGKADKATALETINRLAEDIYLSADCAIGYDAGATALRAIRGFKEDFACHLEHGECGASKNFAVPCAASCPAHVDIPGYIALVAEGRFQDAVRLVRKDNPFVSACGLVCEHPCELSCRRGMIDAPINIRALKRYAAEHCANDYTPFHYEKTGKRVAIIGGGPSGLTAAYYLAIMGHEPTVFERNAHLGGMMRYGIPSYRLPREILDAEIDFLLNQGIETKLGVSIPQDISFETLYEEYDAVYVAIGAYEGKRLGLPGENAEGVLSAVQLLRAIGNNQAPDFTGKRVAVIGGGNVAMDCARSAVRLGADHVSIVYRRRIDDMTAQREEIDGAIAEGCELKELYAPVSIAAEDDKVVGLEIQRQMISAVDRGRPKPVKASVPSEVIPVDIVLVAIGQAIDSEPFEKAGMPASRGIFSSDDFAFANAEKLPGVLVGGDCESGPATVIRAVAAGKVAASNIDAYLGYDHKITSEVDVPTAIAADKPACGRCTTMERPAADRKNDFDLMEQGLLPDEAMQEARRCLRCDRFGMGAFRGGRSVQW